MDIISTAVFTGYQKMLIISHNIIRDMVFISSVHFRTLLYQNRTLIKLLSWYRFL